MNSNRRIWFAIGNPLRGDDGVAHHAVSLLQDAPFVRKVHQLTPELAADLEGMDEAVFIDADVSATTVTFEPLDCAVTRPLASHHLTPAEVLLLGQSYFGFRGDAYLCRIPAKEFDLGSKLSAEATKHAADASHILKLRLSSAIEDLSHEVHTLRSSAGGCNGSSRNCRR